MLAPARPALSPILDEDLGGVGDFLHRHLNEQVSAAAWADSLRVPWPVDAPNHGYQLTIADRVVGVHLAFYSTRPVGDQVVRFCNLGAWCVDDAYRADGLRLLRALLAQRGYTFTDLSPSGNVVGLNERLGFRRVDTPTSLVPAVPWPAGPRTRVSSDPAVIASTLRGRDREIYDHHRTTAAAKHLLITRSGESCYVVLRRDRRRGLNCFATILYASNPPLLHAAVRPLASHLLLRHGIAAVLVEDQVAGGRPRGGVVIPRLQRPKMVRGTGSDDQIDYLYSELTCVAW
jgi:uncharacterized RDD family membrane protein YckC